MQKPTMKILKKNLSGFVHYRRKKVIESILESAKAQQTYADLLQNKNQPIEVSKQKARLMLMELSSAYNANALRVCYWIVRLIKRFMFDDIILYGDEITEIHRLTRDGKILFYLPNHKSHMDYLLLSYNLFSGEVAPPHIAAGVNLAFFPVGSLFRKTGAYFIRRKISGNFLYKKFLQYYFDWMLSEKISQEFYMEGGRSRDGKIREVQSGLLTLFVEEILSRKIQDSVYLVPTSISYDRVPEIKSLLNELKGFEKEKESMLSVIGSVSKLWTDHANVHIQFGKPIALTSIGEFQLGVEPASVPNDKGKSVRTDEFVRYIDELSRNVFGKVQMQKIVTVSSLIALIVLSAKDFIEEKEARARADELMFFLKPCAQNISQTLANIQQNWNTILDRYQSLGWYTRIKNRLQINNEKRLEMNYYKNDLLPLLVRFFPESASNVRHILVHEFPHAFHTKTRSIQLDLDRDFLDRVIAPMLAVYEAVQNQIEIKKEKNILNTEVQKKILAALTQDRFPFPEMLTTEAIHSACTYFQQHSKITASG